MIETDPRTQWIGEWSRKWISWQMGRLPPQDQHLSIVQELLSVHPNGFWHRAILSWPWFMSQEQRTPEFWIHYLCETTNHLCFLKPRLNGGSDLTFGVQLIYTCKEDLVPLLLSYPDAVDNVRQFSEEEFEVFLTDTLCNWNLPQADF